MCLSLSRSRAPEQAKMQTDALQTRANPRLRALNAQEDSREQREKNGGMRAWYGDFRRGVLKRPRPETAPTLAFRTKKSQPIRVGILGIGGNSEYESPSVACRKPSASPEIRPLPEPGDQRQPACDLGLHPRRDARSPLAVGWETAPRAPACHPCFPRSDAG